MFSKPSSQIDERCLYKTVYGNENMEACIHTYERRFDSNHHFHKSAIKIPMFTSPEMKQGLSRREDGTTNNSRVSPHSTLACYPETQNHKHAHPLDPFNMQHSKHSARLGIGWKLVC